MLTARQNMYEAVKGGSPDRYVNSYEALCILSHPHRVFHDKSPVPGGEPVLNSWGVLNAWPEGQPGEFPVHTPEHLVVKDIEDWMDYVKAPKLDFPQSEWDFVKQSYDEVDTDKAYKCVFVAPGIFEMTHHLCSLTEALVYYMTNEDEMKDLVKYIGEWELQLAEGICEHLHPDALLHHDDWGSQTNSFLRPEMFEEYFVDVYSQVYGYYHDHGVEMIVHHSDSYGANLVPYMIDMGIDVWQGVMETNNPPELVAQYGDRIAFMGNVDNKDVDHLGWTEEECAVAAARACSEISLRKGYIPSITQGGPGSTFPGAYEALVRAIDAENSKQFGFTLEQLADARMPIQVW